MWRFSRQFATQSQRQRNNSTLLYTATAIVGTLGLSYAAVPLYRMFCAATGIGGTPTTTSSTHTSTSTVKPHPSGKIYRVHFNSDLSDTLKWSFKPSQKELYVVPGETALAFYRAKNLDTRDMVGVSTYNVTPGKAGAYFNKIQCFCFEEQLLHAGEEIDMPVFFFLDPEIVDDPSMQDVETITLSYTFFNAKAN